MISSQSSISQTTFLADPFDLILDPINQYNLKNIFEEQSFVNILDPISNFDSSFIFDNSFVVIIFTPLVFFLFIFAEDVKFKIEKVRPLSSFISVILILSTVVVTQYSISTSYWPEAYADSGDLDQIISDNTTASTDATSSSSTPAEDTDASEATTSNTDTSVGAPSSSTPAEDNESTEVSSYNVTSINDSFTNNSTTVTLSNNTNVPINGTVIPVTNYTGSFQRQLLYQIPQNHDHLTPKSMNLAL